MGSVLALIFATLTVVTLVVPDWVEAVFRLDPDEDSGAWSGRP